MLVYDITNEKSFDNIKNWIRNIEEVKLNYRIGRHLKYKISVGTKTATVQDGCVSFTFHK
jgi:GTPase SAR1 family protein